MSLEPERFQHDADGNLIRDARFDYVWNANNRLIAVESRPALPNHARIRLAFDYDHQGRRIRKTVLSYYAGGAYAATSTCTYVYDGWNVIAEIRDTGTASRTNTYLWGKDLSGSLAGAGGIGGLIAMTRGPEDNALLFTYDGNGNIMALVDATDGSLAAEYEYGPFGEPLKATGPAAQEQPFRFSTKYTDPESGLVYYGYRHYCAGTGRWASRDPIGETGGANTYVIVGNSPTVNADWLGLDAFGIPNGAMVWAEEFSFAGMWGVGMGQRQHGLVMWTYWANCDRDGNISLTVKNVASSPVRWGIRFTQKIQAAILTTTQGIQPSRNPKRGTIILTANAEMFEMFPERWNRAFLMEGVPGGLMTEGLGRLAGRLGKGKGFGFTVGQTAAGLWDLSKGKKKVTANLTIQIPVWCVCVKELGWWRPQYRSPMRNTAGSDEPRYGFKTLVSGNAWDLYK